MQLKKTVAERRSLVHLIHSCPRWARVAIPGGILLVTAAAGWAVITDLTFVATLHGAAAEHLDQEALFQLVSEGRMQEAFAEAFEHGDELFETTFNALDGVGAKVGQGQRFTRIPRADMAGAGEWANHVPYRATGPNAAKCNACHNLPGDDGAGGTEANVHRDPNHTGELAKFIQRNTPHLFAAGAVQRLAEEMTEELHGQREAAVTRARTSGRPVMVPLSGKGVGFGDLTAQPSGSVDTSGVRGISADLVVRPFQWKGTVAFLRDFNRDACHNELGMQAVELVGSGVDGDSDGVTDELTVGDQTALAVYLASQPRPTTRVELASLGLIPPLSGDEQEAITGGAALFAQIGCATCHTPTLTLERPIFSEPSQNPNYRDTLFPAGQDPVQTGVNPAFAVLVDLTLDQPDNRIAFGGGTVRLGSLQTVNGKAVVNLYGDLKRHDMGPGLAEAIDEKGTGASVFLTENLWGVASTAPYLHDGRATTLTEAILEHGGESASSRDAFLKLTPVQQKQVITLLENLVLFKKEE